MTVNGDPPKPRVDRPRYAALRKRIRAEHPSWNDARVDAAMELALTGTVSRDVGPGHGGAGLVLATPTGEILASRACAFPAADSDEAERQAVIRGALWVRWARGIAIYTDSQSTWRVATSVNVVARGFNDVRYLRKHERGAAHEFAHQLSVEGRLRQASRSSAQVINEEHA